MWSPRSKQSQYLKCGKETFRDRAEGVGFDIFKFWRWAHSDLLGNAARGVLAEYLVARALNYTCEPRHEWDAVDAETKSGLKVEVKSAAYAQSWPRDKPSVISFNIAKKKVSWNAKTDKYEKYCPPKRVADVYVFCLLIGQSDYPGPKPDPDPDPLDLSQWEFYVLPTKKLPNQKTISFNPLKDLVKRATGRSATPYEELEDVIEELGKGSKAATEDTCCC